MENDLIIKPSIVVAVKENANLTLINEILFGIEEEGIPYSINEDLTGNAQELAFQAGRQSKLNVGIGYSNNELILHQRNLSKEYFVYRIQNANQVKKSSLRTFGINSARLVKNIPFNINKELEVLN